MRYADIVNKLSSYWDNLSPSLLQISDFVALGLSVDFTLHYAIMYKLSPDTDRYTDIKVLRSRIIFKRMRSLAKKNYRGPESDHSQNINFCEELSLVSSNGLNQLMR
jgi:hypothetical protein